MKPLQWTPEHIEAFGPSVLASPFGMAGPLDVLVGSFLYEFSEGSHRALIAARPLTFAQGKRLDVVGLVSLGERLKPAALDAALMDIAKAHGAQAVAMCTKWPHIARACARAGWTYTGQIMNKKVTP